MSNPIPTYQDGIAEGLRMAAELCDKPSTSRRSLSVWLRGTAYPFRGSLKKAAKC
jgi:hypothetical protein